MSIGFLTFCTSLLDTALTKPIHFLYPDLPLSVEWAMMQGGAPAVHVGLLGKITLNRTSAEVVSWHRYLRGGLTIHGDELPDVTHSSARQSGNVDAHFDAYIQAGLAYMFPNGVSVRGIDPTSTLYFVRTRAAGSDAADVLYVIDPANARMALSYNLGGSIATPAFAFEFFLESSFDSALFVTSYAQDTPKVTGVLSTVSSVTGLAVDNYRLYWTESNGKPGIWTSNLTSDAQSALPASQGRRYNGLLLSQDMMSLYATSCAPYSQLHSFDLTSGSMAVLASGLNEGVELYHMTFAANNLLFLSDPGTNSIYSYHDGETSKVWSSTTLQPQGITVVGNVVYVQCAASALLLTFQIEGFQLIEQISVQTSSMLPPLAESLSGGMCLAARSLLAATTTSRYGLVNFDTATNTIQQHFHLPWTTTTCATEASGRFVYIGASSGIFKLNLTSLDTMANIFIPGSLDETFDVKIVATGLHWPRDMIVNRYNDILVVESGRGIVLYPTSNYDTSAFVTMRAEEGIVMSNMTTLTHSIAHHGGRIWASSAERVFAWVYSDRTTSLARTPFQSEPIVVVEGMNSDGITDKNEGRRGAHTSRELMFDIDGDLFLQVGSLDNVDPDAGRSLVRRIVASDLMKVFAFGKVVSFADAPVTALGLRNMISMTPDPLGKVWGVNMGADFLAPGPSLTQADGGSHTFFEDNPVDTLYRLDNFNTDREYGYPYCFVTGEEVLSSAGARDIRLSLCCPG